MQYNEIHAEVLFIHQRNRMIDTAEANLPSQNKNKATLNSKAIFLLKGKTEIR